MICAWAVKMNNKQVKAHRVLPFLPMGLEEKPLFFNKLDKICSCAGLKHTDSAQSGYGMLAALFFVSFIAGMTTLSIDFERKRLERSQASAAAWHVATLSKAARIYVRNNSFPTATADTDGDGLADDNNNDGIVDDTFSMVALQADADNVIPITLNDLNNAELLPPNFTLTNVWGQDANIFAALYPMTAGPIQQQPAAYVLLDEGPRPNPLNMKSLVIEAAQFDASFNAPIFDNTGANVTGDCDGDGEEDLANWGAGNSECLDISDYTRFGVAAAFQPGSLIVPTWRMEFHDDRAMLRYRQPGLSDANTMLTDLKFGEEAVDAAGACTDFLDVFIPDGTATDFTDANGNTYNQVSSGVCKVIPEEADVNPHAITQNNIIERDRRVDIQNVSNLDIRQVILADQQLENPTVPVQEIQYDYAAATFATDGASAGVTGSPTSDVIVVEGRAAAGADPGAPGDVIVGGSMHITNRMGNPHTNPANYIPSLSFRGVLADGSNSPAVNELSVDHNLTVVSRNGNNLSMLVNGFAEVGQANIQQDTLVDNMVVDVSNPANFYGSSVIDITNLVVDPANTNFNEGVLASNLNLTGIPNLNIPLLDVVGTLTTQGMTVSGTSPIAGYSLIVDQAASSGDLTVTGTLDVGNELQTPGNAVINGGTNLQFCAAQGRCPDISEEPPACAGVTC